VTDLLEPDTLAPRSGEPEPAPTAAKSWALPHRASLDGLRGVAVAAVVGYHLGLSWLKGGFLGVSLFFTLSGFLITNLLLAEGDASGSVGLGTFWGRRARRLLPAACAGVALSVAVATAVGSADQLARLPGDVLGAFAYVANWRLVLDHSTYQAGFQAPSPLLHYWSLAIEEQFYLVLPLVVVALTRTRPYRRRLLGVVLFLLALSAAATVVLGGSADPNRVYFGTDTRMFEVLAGVLLAVVIRFPAPTGPWPRPSLAADRPGPGRGARTAVTGVASAVVTAAVLTLWSRVPESSHWLYQGGLWVAAALSCGLIVCALRGGWLGHVLGWLPLVALGRVSYGVYVYHWPLFLLLDPKHTGLDGLPLVTVRLAATGVVAALSYRFLEQPIRDRRLRLPRPTPLVIPALMAVILVIAGQLAAQAPLRAVAAVARHPVVLKSSGVSGAAATPTPTAGGSSPTAPGSVSGVAGTATGGAVPPLSRVLFIGDSLVHQALPTFSRRLAAEGVQTAAIGGFGQSLTYHQAAWLPQIEQSVATFDPDVVVLESCCGRFRVDPVELGADGQPIPLDTPPFYAEIRRLALQMTAAASARGAVVLWVLGPPTHTNGWYGPIDQQIPKVNAVYRSLAGCVPGMGFADWRVVTGPDGGYAAALPNSAGEMVQIRNADGFHFAPAGIDLLAGLTLAAVHGQWSVDHGRLSGWDGQCPAPQPEAPAGA